MWGLLQRAVLPVLLLAVGVALTVYGVRHHEVVVFEEQEIEVDLPLPEMPPDMAGAGEFGGPPGFGGDPGFGGEPGFEGPPGPEGMPGDMDPFGLDPRDRPKVIEIVLVDKSEPETTLVRDVTIGGLMRLDSGELKRTYSGKPPSLCPT